MTHTPRRWYYWHFSSYVVSAIPLIFFLLVSVPGGEGYSNMHPVRRFGWPYCHYLQCETNPQIFSSAGERLAEDFTVVTWNGSRRLVPAEETYYRDGHWSNLENWKYVKPGAVGRFLWYGLGMNLALAATICLGVGAAWEVLRRRRWRLFRFTIRQLCFAIVGVSACLAIPIYRLEHQKKALARIPNSSVEYSGLGSGSTNQPVHLAVGTQELYLWLNRLTNYKYHVWHERYGFPESLRTLCSRRPHWASFPYPAEPNGQPLDAATFASQLDAIACLDNLDVGCLADEKLEAIKRSRPGRLRLVVAHQGSPRQLEELLALIPHVGQLYLNDVDLERSGFNGPTLSKLQELDIDQPVVGEKTVAWLARQPNLRIVHLHYTFPKEKDESVQARLPGVYVHWVKRPMGGGSFGAM